MNEVELSDARERVLNVAERHFSERGYKAVTLRDIADELGMKQASLYYHVPGGKEALYIEVMARSMERHRRGIEAAIAGAGSRLEDQLGAAARWLLSQPPMDYGRMLQSDMHSIDKAHADRLAWLTFDALIGPIAAAFFRAAEAGYISLHNHQVKPVVLAGSLISIVESLNVLKNDYQMEPPEQLADAMIDVIINGLRPR